MSSFSQVYAELRRRNRTHYALVAGCCFFSVLLITAYVLMMRSPTVLSVLPEGGDSRKQVMMIFVLTVIGCGVFTAYASGLFFRYKSSETGVFLALGATKAQIGKELRRELTLLSLGSCAAGMILGAPLAWGVWQLFRALVVDSAEMTLSLNWQALGFALAFSLYVLVMLFWMLARFIRRTNIIDIVSEARKSEPIRDVPRWYGPLGIVLVVSGALLGYLTPAFCVLVLRWYPPEGLTALAYLPALIGLYMILLHTVVNGWHQGKNRYTHLVTTSMMRFQGRQTVRNLLVVTVLIAGAYFASFYSPMLGTGVMLSYDTRKVDYAFHYRADQNMISQGEIEALADQMGVNITSFVRQPTARLAIDGDEHVETEGKFGTTYTEVYREQLESNRFLSERAYNALTGEHVDLAPGTITAVYDDSGNSNGRMDNAVTLLTNAVTGHQMNVASVEPVLCSDVLFGYRVMDDGDYALLTAGLPEEWREEQVFFNVQNCADTYDFSKALFNEIVNRSGPEVEVYDSWDPVEKARVEAEGKPYFCDNTHLEENGFERIDYEKRDSSNFRLSWEYMPLFRVLDKAEFVKTMAVFLMLFIFIAILCFAAVFIILFTRCMTIALTNATVYDDLRHLGASNAYLYQTVKKQISRVFFVPALTGTALICAFYGMILYFNDGRLSLGEWAGMGVCALLITAVSVLLYGIYRLTLRCVCTRLRIHRASSFTHTEQATR